MENQSREQPRESGEQIQAQPTRPPPTAQQLAAFAAANHQTRQKRGAPEAFAPEIEASARRAQAPQSTGVHKQRFLPASNIAPQEQGQAIILTDLTAHSEKDEVILQALEDHDHSQLVIPALITSPHQESSVIAATQDQAHADLREQLREEVRKEMEILWESRLAKRTSEVENVWRAKREERTKVVEEYWKQKLAEAHSHHSHGIDSEPSALHEEIEKLKKRLEKGPGLIKAAEERGKRQGELDGFNKFSLNPDLKPSQDRLNFDLLMKDKDKELAEVRAVRDNWFKDARKFSEDTNAMLRDKNLEIQRLQAQIQSQQTQQSIAQENTDALIAEGRTLQAHLENQTQELASLREQCNQQAADLAGLRGQLNQKSQESSERGRQIGIKSAELSLMAEELRKKNEEISSLPGETDRKSVELNEEVNKKSEEIEKLREERHQDSQELSNYRRQVEEQSNEIATILNQQADSDSSRQEKERQIESLRELLYNSNRPQSTNSEQEEVKRLRKELAGTDSRLTAAEAENASLRDIYARIELEGLPTESPEETAESDVELVRVMLEKERTKNEEENSRREKRVTRTLESLEQAEKKRRQMLMEELEGKDAELFEARKEVRELNKRLLAGNHATAAASAVASSSQPSPPSPIKQSSPPSSNSSAAGSRSWYQLPRLPAIDTEVNISLQRLLIFLAIILPAFFHPALSIPNFTTWGCRLGIARGKNAVWGFVIGKPGIGTKRFRPTATDARSRPEPRLGELLRGLVRPWKTGGERGVWVDREGKCFWISCQLNLLKKRNWQRMIIGG